MTYPTRTGQKITPQDNALGERAKSLAGLNGTPEKVAITRGDAASLGAVALKSVKVIAAPTAAQHNALVDDIRAIATALNAMGANFTGI